VFKLVGRLMNNAETLANPELFQPTRSRGYCR